MFICLTARASFAIVVANVIPSAFALSLGGEQLTSSLGQPLRLVIPLLGSTTDSLETRCFRMVAPSLSDGLSVITQARIELQTTTNPPQLIIRSNRSIDEPVVRISIEAGCDAPIRRDYTILLDPPSVQPLETRSAPVAPSQSLPIAAERPPITAKAPELSAADKAAIAAERAASRRAANAAAARKSSAAVNRDNALTARPGQSQTQASATTATAKQLRQDKLEVQGGSRSDSTPQVADASLAALAVPRLRIASDLMSFSEPGRQPGAAPVDELQAAIAKDRRARLIAAPIESDLAPRLEADLVVAQRRLAELQSQLAAAGMVVKNGAPADTSAAANSQPPSTAVAPAASAGWDWRNWIWIPGLLLVAGLIGFLMRQRRSPTQPQFAAVNADDAAYSQDDEITVVRTVVARNDVKNQPNIASLDEPTVLPVSAATAARAGAALTPSANQARVSATPNPIIATRDEREAADRLNNPLFQLRDTESHVDVTELSQVTDEAQVYADLGRNDQAIELLRDHIDAQTGEVTSPAPWLMIFELYRRTNNRQGYDELAPQFRKHFNGRVPDWDNYGHELALDDGLEAFPHLVARIERDWGTAEARKFLEELLYDNRGGSRLGFSLAAYRDILLLLQVHEGLTIQPDFLANATDWESRGANDSDGTPKWDLSLEMIEPPKSSELESFLNRPPPDKF